MADIPVLNPENFSQSVEGGEGLTLVDFTAEWCSPCRMIGPALVDLAREYGDKLQFAKVDADTSGEVLVKYGVRGLPTLIMFEDGQPVGSLVGAQPASALKNFIGQYLP